MKPTTNRVLISGAGIAGLTLAYLLKKQGFLPTVVERSPVLRTGGYKIDIRGSALEVVRRMGISEALYQKRTDVDDVVVYDYQGNRVASMDIDVSGGRVAEDIELMRGDLCHVLKDAVSDVECLFGDSVTEVREGGHDLRISFEKHPPRSFDLLIGADGLHSKVRGLVFGEESQFLKPLGMYVSVFSVPHLPNAQEKEFLEPGKYINIYNSRDGSTTTAAFGFISKEDVHPSRSRKEQQELLLSAFKDAPEEVQALLSKAGEAVDFYFDIVAQVHMPTWSKGRVALVGDAGYAPTPISGQGTSMALLGAYVLADELGKAKGDYGCAFERYEARFRRFVVKNQELVGFSVAYMGVDPDAWTSRLLRFLIEKNPAVLAPLLKEFGVAQIHDAAESFQFHHLRSSSLG